MGFYWILWASRPNYVIPHPWGSWACHQPLTFFVFITLGLPRPHSHFSTSYIAHDLLFLSFRAPLSPFSSSRPICLPYGLVIYYSCRLDLMGFLFVCQLFYVRVAGLFPSTWASEMAINNWNPRLSPLLTQFYNTLCKKIFIIYNHHMCIVKDFVSW